MVIILKNVVTVKVDFIVGEKVLLFQKEGKEGISVDYLYHKNPSMNVVGNSIPRV